MQYEDSARQYNFLVGLGIGAVLGVGLAMLALPQKKVLLRRARASRRGLGKGFGTPRLARRGEGGGRES